MFTNNSHYDENAFAEANHYIIERFLRQKRLPQDDYYDVVVFGFLRAVRQYCSRPELREKYEFSTIAWRKMTDDLCKHYKTQSRPSHRAVTVSFDSPLYDDNTLTMAEVIPDPYQMAESVETAILWEKVAGLLTDEQHEALYLRADGYTDREIAASRKRRVSDVRGIFDGIRETVACLGLVAEGCGV